MADEALAGSTRLQFRSLLSDLGSAPFPLVVQGRTFIVGETICCDGNMIELKPLAFSPGKGFHSSDAIPQAVNIHVPDLAMRSMSIRPGVQLICAGPLVPPTKKFVYNFATSASIHFRPEFDCTFGWECTHLFCGAFCGWSQAIEWLPNAGFGFTIVAKFLWIMMKPSSSSAAHRTVWTCCDALSRAMHPGILRGRLQCWGMWPTFLMSTGAK